MYVKSVPVICQANILELCYTCAETGPAGEWSVSKHTSVNNPWRLAYYELRRDDDRQHCRRPADCHSSQLLFLCDLILHFYPRDAMLARVFAIATCLSGRLDVCLSVTRRYCAQHSESRIVRCTPSDSPITLVSGKVWFIEKFVKGHPKGTCQMRVGWVFGDFWPICRHISKTVHFRH